ncbi:hypothetical protein LB505_013786 [Fusarium chuoi]|nr:hypothetical protein LB505_013786 [Fusarium chuoi]
MSLLRSNIATPHVACLRLRLRALQKASIVAALSTCAYLSASSKLSSYHVSNTASVTRPSTDSLPHLAPFRNKLRSPPSLVTTTATKMVIITATVMTTVIAMAYWATTTITTTRT